MIFDLRTTVPESQDFEVLASILRTVIGEPCLKAELSYLEELTLHFGQPLPYTHPKLKGDFRGSWTLGTLDSQWEVVLIDPPLLIHYDVRPEPGDVAAIETSLTHLSGASVLDVYPRSMAVPGAPGLGWALLLRLSNGAHLSVLPSEDPERTGLADWELFTPFGMYLRCGPGDVWSYLPSGDNETPKDVPGGPAEPVRQDAG